MGLIVMVKGGLTVCRGPPEVIRGFEKHVDLETINSLQLYFELESWRFGSSMID